MVTYPNVKATEALRISKKLTEGLKTQMFLADLCIGAIVFFAFLVLGLFAAIPIIGILFGIVLFAAYILVVAFGGVFTGLYQAYFFEVCGGIARPQPQQQYAPVNNQPQQQVNPVQYAPQQNNPQNY